MKTVDKALSVLTQFTLEKPEIGLSDLARRAGLDKATTRRLLVAMAKHGFIEQSEANRTYRLGHGFLRLAYIREAAMPISRIAQEAVDWLAETTDETAHVSIPGEAGMTTIAYRLPNRAHVINIVPTQVRPYHATASGLIYWAHATEATSERIFHLKRVKLTEATLTAKTDLRSSLKRFRDQGFSISRRAFEVDASSIAAPFWRGAGDPAGCVALVLPKENLSTSRIEALLPSLREAVARVERALTGL